MKKLDHNAVKDMLVLCADVIIESKPFLTEIDSAIGDGDHGIGMAKGMTAVKKKLLESTDCCDVYKLFQETGKAMIMSMGGASGVIFGTMFMGGAKGRSPAGSITTKEFADLMESSLAAIKARGMAEIGDKTMVDAFEPAVVAMQEYNGDSFEEMLSLAEKAAYEGVENTKSVVAKFGRAKFLGERSLGYQDAGATSTWIILRTMREYVSTKRSN